MKEQAAVIVTLVPLIKYFISWSTVTVNGNILQVTSSCKTIKITNDTVKNTLRISVAAHHSASYDEPDMSQFDLCDPRSIPATIRSACRRAGKEMPSFETIDHLLENGIPKDVTDMWAAMEK